MLSALETETRAEKFPAGVSFPMLPSGSGRRRRFHQHPRSVYTEAHTVRNSVWRGHPSPASARRRRFQVCRRKPRSETQVNYILASLYWHREEQPVHWPSVSWQLSKILLAGATGIVRWMTSQRVQGEDEIHLDYGRIQSTVVKCRRFVWSKVEN